MDQPRTLLPSLNCSGLTEGAGRLANPPHRTPNRLDLVISALAPLPSNPSPEGCLAGVGRVPERHRSSQRRGEYRGRARDGDMGERSQGARCVVFRVAGLWGEGAAAWGAGIIARELLEMELDAAEVWIRENLAVVKVDAVPFDKGCSPAKSEAPISPTSTTSASTQSPALHKFSYTRPPPFSLSLALPLTSSSDSATPARRYIGGLTSSVTADQLISLFSTVILRPLSARSRSARGRTGDNTASVSSSRSRTRRGSRRLSTLRRCWEATCTSQS